MKNLLAEKILPDIEMTPNTFAALSSVDLASSIYLDSKSYKSDKRFCYLTVNELYSLASIDL